MSDTEDSTGESAGATIVWFGKDKGKRFDQLDYGYRLWAVYSETAQTFAWHDRVVELHEQCLRDDEDSLSFDERPGNLAFSWSRSQPFRKLYGDKGWMSWCHRNLKNKSRWQFLDTKKRYEAWLAGHRRKYRPRGPSDATRDIGEKCGPWDDKDDPVPENDTYDSDDSFIDNSGEGLLSPPPGEEYASGDEDGGSAAEFSATVEGQEEEDDEEEVENSEIETADSQYEADSDTASNVNDENDHPLVKDNGRPRVLEIPSTGPVPDAKDLFNDDPTEMIPNTSASKRGSETESDEDDDKVDLASPRKRRLVRAPDDDSEGQLEGGQSDLHEDLFSQLAIKTPQKKVRFRAPESSRRGAEVEPPVPGPSRHRSATANTDSEDDKPLKRVRSPSAKRVEKARAMKFVWT